MDRQKLYIQEDINVAAALRTNNTIYNGLKVLYIPYTVYILLNAANTY